jgi:hypothetical protein
MRSIGTRAITFASSLLARGITLKSSTSRFSNSVAVARNVWFAIAFDPETAALIRQSSGTADDAYFDGDAKCALPKHAPIPSCNSTSSARVASCLDVPIISEAFK